MSIDDLKAFFALLEIDTTLQDKARALQGRPEAERFMELCRLAAGAGFTVTPEDLSSAAARPAGAELDDVSLRAVVGGFCSSPGLAAPNSQFEFRG
jgi:predicted ribosomally synthesized peptide with nif11-like leader